MQQNPPSPPDGSPPTRTRLPLWKAWLPPLLILAAAAALAFSSYRGLRDAQNAAFRQEAQRIEAGVSDRLRDYELQLHSALGLLNTPETPTHESWRSYVERLDYANFFPDALGLGFAPLVPADGLAAHERQRRSVTPGYAVFPPGARPFYLPVLFMEPKNARSQRAIGFDMASEPVRRAAIERARDSGATVLTGKVILTRSAGEYATPSGLLIVPAYLPGAPTGTVPERRAAFRGVLFTPFRVHNLLTAIFGAGQADLGLAVYQNSAQARENLLFEAPLPGPPGLIHTTALDLYGQKWVLVFSRPQQSLFAPGRREPLALLFLGAVLAAIVHFIVRNLDAPRARAEALARDMTAELRQSDEYNRAVFQHSSLPIAVCGPDDRFQDVNTAMLDLLGYTREDFLRLFWQDIIHPDDWAENARLTREALNGERNSYRLELRVVDRQRQPVWGLLSVGLVRGEDGAVRFFIGTLKDISGRKAAEAAQAERRALYQAMFEDNRSVCFLVDPEDGRIVDANRAASLYYGYTRGELQSMRVSDLNTLPQDQLVEALREARSRGSMFDFEHRLKDGSLRRVRVHTGPFESGGKPLLLSTVQDVTDQMLAEAALTESRERFRNLVESTDQGVVLNDEADVITYVNPAFARMIGHPQESLVGQLAGAVLSEEAAAQRVRRMTERRQGSREPYEMRLLRADGTELLVRIMPFPLFDAAGVFRGSGGLVVDITAQHAAQAWEQQQQERRAALLKLHEMQHASRQELLDFALEQVLKMTGSPFGYIYAYNDEAREFSLHSWSPGVMDQCRVQEAQSVYKLEQTGVWGDAVRTRAPVLLNDFSAPHPGKRGHPEGHLPLTRFLTVPVIRAGRVRAVVGVANKTEPYTEEDVAQLTLFTTGVWGILERQQAEKELREVTERFQRAVRAGRVGLWEWDLETGMARCDAVMEEIFGLTDRNRTGTPEDWLSRVAADEREAVRQALTDAAAKGQRFAASFRVQKPGGEVVHVEASAVAQLAPSGQPLRLAGVHIDVSRLRVAEQKLAQSHRFLQTIIDSLPHTLFCKDTEGRFLLVNQAFADMRGGQPMESYLHKRTEEVEPGELSELHRLWDERVLAAGPGETMSYEYSLPLEGGGMEHRMVYKSLVQLPEGGTGIVGINVDNTRRKMAEAQLAQSEERFRHLYENAPIPYQSLDADGRLLLVNTAWLDSLGYAADEVLGRGFTDFLDQDSVPLFREQFARFKARGVVSGVEYLLRTKNGGRLLVSVNGRVALDAKGGFLSTHCTFQDITERRAAEEKLARSHRFLQTLIDTLPMPFVCKDEQSRYLLVNESFARLYGLDKAEVLGRSIREFGPAENADRHETSDAEVLALPEGGSLQYELDYAPPDMDSRHWLVCKTRLPLADGGTGVAAITVDITERKQAELALFEERRRLADVIEGTGTGTWEWNLATGEAACDERWAQLIGRTLDELAPFSLDALRALVHPEDRPAFAAALGRHCSGEAPFFEVECRLRHKLGGWVWTHMRGRVFERAQDGKPLRMSGALSDIGARKSAEERLELVARFPVENPHPVLRADARGVLLYANPAAASLLASWGQQVGGRLPRELREELREALVTGQARTSERAYASGVYSVTVSPFGDKGYVNIYAADETQRKSAEMALRLSELRYRELAVMLRLMCDNVPDMIWAKDMDNRYLFANKAMCEQFLCLEEGEEALGRTEEEFARRVQTAHPENPDWHTIWQSCAASDAETLSGSGRGQYEEAGYCLGDFKRLDVRKAPFVNDEGVVIGTVGSARDITERKAAEDALARSEVRFRTLAQVSPVGIFQADTTGRCTYVNDQWARISGFPKSAALGFGWLRTLSLADRRNITTGLRQTARTGADFATEFRFRAAEGERRWALARVAAEYGAQGDITGFVGAVTDISEIKAAEVALRKAKAEAEAATEAKALFLANMSHEIRTPLAGVIGTTRLLAQSNLDAAQRQLAEMAVDSGRALLDVVNDILDFSKIEAGRLTLRSAPFLLRRTLASILAPLQLLGRERGLSLDLNVASGTPDALLGDEARLGQVLRNLLTNALKFTESGGVTLTVRARPRGKDEAELSFSVTDTGIGIAPDYLPHIFDSFSQGDSSYGKQHGGTGLGLAICKSLVEQMGGSIQVVSSQGKGSTFTVAAPFRLDVQAEPAPAQEAAPAEAERQPEGLRVLLADDNAIGRVLMEHVLKNAGYQVACVADGNEVLRALRKARYDLVLMDVQMPRMDGLTATRQLRQGKAGAENRNIAVVALTAYTSREDRRNFLDAGMDDAVSKPAEEKPLFEAMQRALAAARARATAGDSAPAGEESPPAAPPAPAAETAATPSDDRLDLEYLERSFGGNPDLLELLLRQFTEKSAPELTRGLDQALAQRNMRQGRSMAHRARGSLSSIGAGRAVGLAAAAEAAAVNEDWVGFAHAAADLKRELDEIAGYLRQGKPWGPAKGEKA
jgi:PAS domain S-box-containing protein